MAKTLYSLMLSEDVVREVDKLAHRMGATRSGLINSILAEYVGFVTPEQRINNILSEVERLLSPTTDLVPFLAPGAMSLSLKSALEYKYRPTVKYEVQLYKGDSSSIGELNVVFRTQSAGLLAAMADFFRLWKRTEEKSAPRRCPISAFSEFGDREETPADNSSASCSALLSSMTRITRLLGRF